MQPHHVLIGLVVIVAAWVAVAVAKNHIASRERFMLSAISAEADQARLDALVAMAAEETKRAQLLARLAQPSLHLKSLPQAEAGAVSEAEKQAATARR